MHCYEISLCGLLRWWLRHAAQRPSVKFRLKALLLSLRSFHSRRVSRQPARSLRSLTVTNSETALANRPAVRANYSSGTKQYARPGFSSTVSLVIVVVVREDAALGVVDPAVAGIAPLVTAAVFDSPAPVSGFSVECVQVGVVGADEYRFGRGQ